MSDPEHYAYELKYKKLHAAAFAPVYATDGSAAFDVKVPSLVDAPSFTLLPKESVAIGTGLAFEVPPGWVLLVASRSGHGFNNGVRLANCIGIIDSDYRGELRVKLHNDSDTIYRIAGGDRIAQCWLAPCPRYDLKEVSELGATKRGEGGMGSTGR